MAQNNDPEVDPVEDELELPPKRPEEKRDKYVPLTAHEKPKRKPKTRPRTAEEDKPKPKPQTVKHTGKVIGHVVSYIPGYRKKRKSRVTVSRPPVLGAFVHILVDDNRYCTVPCETMEKEMDFGVRPTDADRATVYNTLVKAHPLNEIRHFKETKLASRKGKGKTYSKYFLED